MADNDDFMSDEDLDKLLSTMCRDVPAPSDDLMARVDELLQLSESKPAAS